VIPLTAGDINLLCDGFADTITALMSDEVQKKELWGSHHGDVDDEGTLGVLMVRLATSLRVAAPIGDIGDRAADEDESHVAERAAAPGATVGLMLYEVRHHGVSLCAVCLCCLVVGTLRFTSVLLVRYAAALSCACAVERATGTTGVADAYAHGDWQQCRCGS
jgi:hypothetical protein